METGAIYTSQFIAIPSQLLTLLETRTLVKMAEGKAFRQLATELGVTEKTARNYMCRVNHKLAVTDKAAAISRAFCLGILIPKPTGLQVA